MSKHASNSLILYDEMNRTKISVMGRGKKKGSRKVQFKQAKQRNELAIDDLFSVIVVFGRRSAASSWL